MSQHKLIQENLDLKHENERVTMQRDMLLHHGLEKMFDKLKELSTAKHDK